jgi:signal transduction histidine kinase
VRLGLRGRFVAVLALVSALTLAVAAVALFSPLDRLLRANGRETLTQSVRSELGDFTKLSEDTLHPGSPKLLAATRPLRRTGAEVAVLDGSGRLLVTTDPAGQDPFTAAHEALRTGHEYQTITGSGAEAEAEVAVPIKIDGVRAVVTARRSLEDVQDVTKVVRRAFGVAAAAGLLGALLVGGLIAGRTAGRIRRLRDTAERVAQVGPVAEFRPEGGRDEIGDLSRTFALMQTRLREQEQARRTFVSTASHELRTPLASLRLMLGLLAEDLESGAPDLDDARAQVIRAQRQSDRLGQLAANLLDLSRLDAGLPVRRELLALGDTSRAVVAEFAPRSEAAGVPIELAVPDPCWAVADPGSVAQVVRILLDNALRFSPPGSPVEVEVATRDGTPAVTVRDRGPGVEPEDRERIFERFERGRETAEESGFGLGLAIGRELARRMDGELRLDASEAGAAFVLTLPAAPAGALEPTRP